MSFIPTPITKTARHILDTPKTGQTRVQPKPVLGRSYHMGRHPWSRLYTVFMEDENRLGDLWYLGDYTWKGKMNIVNHGEGYAGKYVGYGNAAVVRRAAGSGGNPGALGGWAFSSGTNNEQNFGGYCSISATAYENAVFTATGDVFGIVGWYPRADIGGYCFIAVDGDWTKANGPLIRTVTASDIACGKFPVNFTKNDGTTQASLGAKYLDACTAATSFSEDIGVYEDLTHADTSHTIELLVAGFNSKKDASGHRVGFSGFFYSSPSQGTFLSILGSQGASAIPQSTTQSSVYMFMWREIAGTRIGSGQNSKPVASGSAFVEDRVGEFSLDALTYLFNQQAHADGSTTGASESTHLPAYVAVASGTNNAAQAVLNVRTGDGLGFAANDWIWIESRRPTLRQIQSIATDALTLTANLTYALNLNSASEKIIRCETTVNGAVAASASVTLASATHSIKVGDVLVFVSDATTPVTAVCKSISGTALVLEKTKTIANGCGVMRLCEADYVNCFFADKNEPVYLNPGAYYSPTDSLQLSRGYVSNWQGEGTTANGAALVGATTITVASDTAIRVGQRVQIDSQAPQVRRVLSKAANVLTLDKPLDSYVHTGARVVSTVFYARDTLDFRTNDSWNVECTIVEFEYPSEASKRANYDVMHTSGLALIPAQAPVYTITGATNANPIVLTTSVAHGMTTGDGARLASVGGNTAANGNWPVTVLSATTFSIPATGNANYTSGGTLTKGSVITGATNTNPIVIESVNHQFNTGDYALTAGVTGNTAANGTSHVTKIDADHYSLDQLAGNGAYVSGGTSTLFNPTYLRPFNQIAKLPGTGVPYIVTDTQKQNPFVAGTLILDQTYSDMVVSYSDSHDLVYATKLEQTGALAATLAGTAQTFIQLRSTGDDKIYFSTYVSDGSIANRQMSAAMMRGLCWKKQSRRIRGFKNSVATRYAVPIN